MPSQISAPIEFAGIPRRRDPTDQAEQLERVAELRRPPGSDENPRMRWSRLSGQFDVSKLQDKRKITLCGNLRFANHNAMSRHAQRLIPNLLDKPTADRVRCPQAMENKEPGCYQRIGPNRSRADKCEQDENCEDKKRK